MPSRAISLERELPFVNNDTNDYKFAGKKRAVETGLDYFTRLAGQMGLSGLECLASALCGFR